MVRIEVLRSIYLPSRDWESKVGSGENVVTGSVELLAESGIWTWVLDLHVSQRKTCQVIFGW